MDNNNNIIRLDSIPTTKEGIGIMASAMVNAMTEGEGQVGQLERGDTYAERGRR